MLMYEVNESNSLGTVIENISGTQNQNTKQFEENSMELSVLIVRIQILNFNIILFQCLELI